MTKITSFILLFTIVLAAQERPNSGMGISASYQTSQLSIVLPFWMDELTVIAPSFGFNSVEDSGQDYQLGIAYKKFLNKEKASPFLGAHFGAAIYNPESSDSITDLVYGISAGGEYFVDRNFSFGIEGQLNGSISDKKSGRFGAIDKLILNTATVIYATIYFN